MDSRLRGNDGLGKSALPVAYQRIIRTQLKEKPILALQAI